MSRNSSRLGYISLAAIAALGMATGVETVSPSQLAKRKRRFRPKPNKSNLPSLTHEGEEQKSRQVLRAEARAKLKAERSAAREAELREIQSKVANRNQS